MKSQLRKDIQGLRGLAVVLVILEHATDFVPGGYIGVDVFFVISGFVITKLLIDEFAASGHISFRNFYVRRVRRLFPALVVVLSATLCLSALILSPGLEHSRAVSAAIASFFFVGNLRYIFEGGYFFLQADPFRHLWSLGVEEQFYAFYPLLVVGLLSFAKKFRAPYKFTLVSTLATLSVISLATASLLANGLLLPLSTRLSFFGTPFRLWELMTGAIVAIVLDGKQLRASKYVLYSGQVLGLSLILWSAFTYGPFTLFPGVTALPPVLGTALLIIVGSTAVGIPSIIEWRPMTYLGDISYGLYLWHWPLIVFAERLFPDLWQGPILAVVVSIVLANFQLKLIEDPIRFRSERERISSIKFGAITTSIVLVSSALVIAASNWGTRLSETPSFEQIPTLSEQCGLILENLDLSPVCTVERDSELRILVIGDSQASAVSAGVIAAADNLGASYRVVFGNSCPIHLRPNRLWPVCAVIKFRFAVYLAEFRPNIIVVANAGDLYVTRGGFGRPDARISKEDGSFPRNYEEGLINWTAGVAGQLRKVPYSQTDVIYVHMPPVAPNREPSLVRPRTSYDPFPLSAGFDRNLVVKEEAEALRSLGNVRLFDPASVLCPNDLCQLATSEGPIYSDTYHLNARGARLLAPELQRLIVETRE